MDFLNQQIANNKESEYANQELNKRTAAARSRLIECNDSLQLKSNELAVIRKSLKNLVNALQQTRQKNRQAARDCEKKSKIIENLKVVEDQLKEKLKKLGDKNSTAQDRLRHFNELAEVKKNGLVSQQKKNSIESVLILRKRKNHWLTFPWKWIAWVVCCIVRSSYCNSGNRNRSWWR